MMAVVAYLRGLVGVGAVLGLAVVVSACGVDEPSQATQTIQNGRLDVCPEYTIGERINAYFSESKWQSGPAESGGVNVDVMGEITYKEQPAHLSIRFVVDEESGAYTLGRVTKDGRTQPQETINELFTFLCQAL